MHANHTCFPIFLGLPSTNLWPPRDKKEEKQTNKQNDKSDFDVVGPVYMLILLVNK